ncbi:MAG: DJ-1 family glyoxalase III [Planctomycetota bacterium]
MSEQRVLVPLADGVEEMEVVITADVLRRAGAKLRLLGIEEGPSVTGSRGVVLGCDGPLSGDEDAEMIVIPGGAEGARVLRQDERVLALLRRFDEAERWIAAICAGPSVLVAAGVGKGKEMTSHPSVQETLQGFAGSYSVEPVVVDERLVTARGPGCAFDFALLLVGLLYGAPAAGEVRAPMMFPRD